MPSMKENRRYVRFELDVPANLTVMDGNREIKLLNLTTNDISAEGLYIKTDMPLPQGTQVNMDMLLPISDIVEMQAGREQARLRAIGSVIRTDSDGMALNFEIEKIVIDEDFGLVRDIESGLEWYVGPGKDMTWKEARAWSRELKIEGGNWRMPAQKELESIYEPDSERLIKVDRVFHLTGPIVWCDSPENAPRSCFFDFKEGTGGSRSSEESASCRAMAVRKYKFL